MKHEDLKANRTEIIAFITLMNYDLKFAMEMAVEIADGCDSLDELKEELRMYCRPVKGNKVADLMASAHDGETFNHVTERWEKN